MEDKLTEIKKALYKEKPTAERVNDMGVEKNGTSNTLYLTKSSLGRHWFVIPNKEAENFKQQEKVQLLIKWLEVNED